MLVSAVDTMRTTPATRSRRRDVVLVSKKRLEQIIPWHFLRKHDLPDLVEAGSTLYIYFTGFNITDGINSRMAALCAACFAHPQHSLLRLSPCTTDTHRAPRLPLFSAVWACARPEFTFCPCLVLRWPSGRSRTRPSGVASPTPQAIAVGDYASRGACH